MGGNIRVPADAVGHAGDVDLAQDRLGALVVGVDGGVIHPRGAEEALFAVEIPVHRAEEIQMVLRQVGEAAGGKAHSRQPVQGDRVGGHFHHHIVRSLVRHHPQGFVQVDGVRRCEAGFDQLVADAAADGADQPAFVAGGFQDPLDEVTGGGLSLGTGQADDFHLPVCVAVKLGGGQRHGDAAVRNRQLGHADPLDRVFHDQGAGPFFNRLTGEPVPVEGGAGNAEKEAVRDRLPAVHEQLPDFYIRTGRRFCADAFGKLSEFHR